MSWAFYLARFQDLNGIASGNPRTLPQNDQRELGSDRLRILRTAEASPARGTKENDLVCKDEVIFFVGLFIYL
jgi:hypothetical protein